MKNCNRYLHEVWKLESETSRRQTGQYSFTVVFLLFLFAFLCWHLDFDWRTRQKCSVTSSRTFLSALGGFRQGNEERLALRKQRRHDGGHDAMDGRIKVDLTSLL